MNNELAQLPPTAAFIYYVLEEADRPLTKAEVMERTGRAKSTVEKNLPELRDRGFIESRPKLGDGRKYVYYPKP